MAADDAPPLYDPAVHTDPDVVVLLEMWCRCTAGHRQVDPVSHCAPVAASFAARHRGAGHGPVSAEEALAEREARREAAMRSVGQQDDYAPREREDPPTGPVWDWSALADEAEVSS